MFVEGEYRLFATRSEEDKLIASTVPCLTVDLSAIFEKRLKDSKRSPLVACRKNLGHRFGLRKKYDVYKPTMLKWFTRRSRALKRLLHNSRF